MRPARTSNTRHPQFSESNLRKPMLRNFVLITLRNLRKHRGYSFINIFGRATGLAAFMLILMFVQHETSMDQHHEKGDRIYRVILDAEVMGQTVMTTNTPMPMAEAFVAELPELEAATRVDSRAKVLVVVDDIQLYENRFFLVDSTYFDIFTAELIFGDPRTALTLPNSVVITEEIAEKYFGDSNPMGRSINVDRETDYTVTGIVRFASDRTHFRADFLGSMVTHPQVDSPVWLSNSWNTYILLREDADIAALRAKMPGMVTKHVGPDIERFMGQTYEEAKAAGLRYEFALEKMTDIYLTSKAEDQLQPTGDVRYVYILSSIALFVLLIACINFMNLSTARASSRAREVGLRKVFGSQRAQLIRQFLGESVIMATLSMLIAVVLVAVALPFFEQITGAVLSISGPLVLTMIGVTLLTGLLSGLYPAFVLSGFRPVTVLNGSFSTRSKGSFLRSSLVVFQFAISIALLISTGIVFKQLRFIQDRDIGFQKEQVIVLPLETMAAREGFEAFREELLRNPGVIQVAAASGLPGPNHIHNSKGFRWESAPA
ncbi:MAG: ABC transporter permease, partial [Bacteroidetes bacterium]